MHDDRMTIDERLAVARSRIARLSPSEADEARAAGAVIIDTRDSADRIAEGIIPGSVRITRDTLEWRADPTAELPDPVVSDFDNDLIVVCNDGYGSSLAADSLRRLGHSTVADIIGGYRAWKAAGLPTEPV
jgi:rhodanese-related sulfurtransferase